MKISCKIRPYTLQSNVTFARNSPLSLRAGTLTAHQMSRLMLLGSPPDMVHGIALRKTHSSTRLQTAQTSRPLPLKTEFTPATADFRYKDPLLPRLVWPHPALGNSLLYYYTKSRLLLQVQSVNFLSFSIKSQSRRLRQAPAL